MELKITHFIDYNKFKIKINGLIHIQYPRVPNIRIHAWRDGTNNPVYKIELKSKGRIDEYHYDKKELWEAILKELDAIL